MQNTQFKIYHVRKNPLKLKCAEKKSFTDICVLEQEEVDWVRYDQVFVFTPVDTLHSVLQTTLGIFKVK